jgi:branched-chain amino acid transport system permease protein
MSLKERGKRWILFGILLALLIVAPHVLDPYRRYILTELLMWGLFALGFDIIFGKTGLLNFGMSSFFGMGSYGFVLAVYHLHVNLWGGLLAAILVSLVFSILVGLLITRFASHYFVVFTIVISMILFLLAMNLREFTGGDEGIIIRLRTLPLGPWDVSLRSAITKYYIILGVVGTAFFLVLKFFDSPLGRAIVAVKENEERAKMIGYDTARLKLISFALSGTVAGLAGGLYPILNNNTNAEIFFWILSGKAVLWSVVGGVGTLWGPFIGAGILVYAEDLLSSWLINIYPILVGGLLIIIILLAPKGILGTIQSALMERALQKS